MSYRLDKPYTEKEKVEFIIKQNHQNGRIIFENDIALFALEPNEIIVDGEVIIDPDYEEKQEQIRKEERKQEIKEKIANLNQMALYDVISGNTENVKIYKSVIDSLTNELNSY